MSDERRVVFFGASGFTGRLAAQAAADRGIRFAIAGRDRARLEALAGQLPAAPEVVVADARDPAALREAVGGAAVVCSTVGPFTELGAPVVVACIEAGAHYLDTTGEQRWVAECLDRFDAPARDRGVVLCPSMAFEVAISDCAAHMAAQGMIDVREVDLVYAMHRFATSRGTKLSALHAIGDPGWRWQAGKRAPETPGADVRQATLPDPVGSRSLVSFSSPEAITVPRHIAADAVRVFIAVPPALGPALAFGASILPSLLAGPLGAWARKAVERVAPGPQEARRKQARSQVVAVARSSEGRARSVVVKLEDIYGLTAQILVNGAIHLIDGGVAPGFRAPSELVKDPAAFLRGLATYGVEAQVLETDVLAPPR